MQKHSRTIQRRAFGTDDRAEQSCWEPWQQWGGLAHDAGCDRSHPMRGNHDQDRNSRAARSEPSDTGLGCPTRCLAAHTAPSEELRQDSTLFPVWTRVLGRDRTLRRDGVPQVWWGTMQPAPAMGGSWYQQLTCEHLIYDSRCSNNPQACSKWTLVQRQVPTDGRNS